MTVDTDKRRYSNNNNYNNKNSEHICKRKITKITNPRVPYLFFTKSYREVHEIKVKTSDYKYTLSRTSPHRRQTGEDRKHHHEH